MTQVAKPHPWSDSVAYLLRNSYRVFARALQERIQAEGIPIGSWPFLRHLWQQDGITQKELTKAVGLMQPNTNAALKQLVRRGWVKQTPDSDDKRKIQDLPDAQRPTAVLSCISVGASRQRASVSRLQRRRGCYAAIAS